MAKLLEKEKYKLVVTIIFEIKKRSGNGSQNFRRWQIADLKAISDWLAGDPVCLGQWTRQWSTRAGCRLHIQHMDAAIGGGFDARDKFNENAVSLVCYV